MSSLSTAEGNALWAQLLVETLYRRGVRRVCLSPGSRNTPLVLAVEAHPELQSSVHFDERGTGFMALGMAKATERPVALACTSGTAAANYLPAVAEASRDHVPLVVLTADRPRELFACGANQTIEQQMIYHRQVRFEHDFEPPSDIDQMAAAAERIHEAMSRCCAWPPGPVHLNCRFREPFVPAAMPGLDEYPALQQVTRGEPPTRSSHDPGALQKLRVLLTESRRGLTIVGSIRTKAERDAAAKLSRRLDWPVFADVQSGLGQLEHRLAAHDLLLRAPSFRAALNPDAVLLLGGRLTSKRLAAWLGQGDFPVVQLGLEPQPGVPVPGRVQRLSCSLQDAAQLIDQFDSAKSELSAPLADLAAAADAIVSHVLDGRTELVDQVVAREISGLIPGGHHLFLGNSLAIRQYEMFGKLRPIVCNRGASGIDGNLATAAGYAIASEHPVCAVLGDLAALHDLNSLALWKRLPAPSVVIVVNNGGGGIFHFLPAITDFPHFDRCFVAEHEFAFGGAAGMFGLTYRTASSAPELREGLRAAFRGSANAVLEIKVNRVAARSLDDLLTRRLVEAL